MLKWGINLFFFCIAKLNILGSKRRFVSFLYLEGTPIILFILRLKTSLAGFTALRWCSVGSVLRVSIAAAT
jgi:hypothetical protein